jgi:hypothetical protein
MGWDSFKIKEQQANANKISSYQESQQKVKNEVAGLMRKLKFDAMVSGGTNIGMALKQVGVKVPFGRRITPIEAQRAAQTGALKKRAY